MIVIELRTENRNIKSHNIVFISKTYMMLC